jgi:hypothetical protein
MFETNTDRIRFATEEDADTLRSLAERASQKPLDGRVLIGDLDGKPAAALSLLDGRAIAESSRRAARLVVALRLRAGTIRAYEATPSLRERLVKALPPYRGTTILVPVSPALRSWPPSWREGHDRLEDERDLAA